MTETGIHPSHPAVDLLRGCAGCNAFILTNDPTSENVFCPMCRPKHIKPFDEWAAGLKVGDRVYVQPYATRPYLARTEHLIVARDGDHVRLQPLGLPEIRIETEVAHLGQHCLARRQP